MEPSETGRHMGHEFIGVVDAVGADVRTLNVGDLVVAPFVWSGGTCIFCREGLQTSCLHGASTALTTSVEARVKRCVFRDGTLAPLPVGKDHALMPSLMTLKGVVSTGHHAVLTAQGGPGKSVAIVGDGVVGLCGVIAACRGVRQGR